MDATGWRVYGAGERRVVKHSVCRQRTWRKLHLGIDENTKEIVAVELTGSRVHDSQQFPSLLEQIPDPIGQVWAAGPTTRKRVTKSCFGVGAMPTLAPLCTAQLCTKDPATRFPVK